MCERVYIYMYMYMYTCVCVYRERGGRETGFESGGDGSKALDVGKQQTHARQILREEFALGRARRVLGAAIFDEHSE